MYMGTDLMSQETKDDWLMSVRCDTLCMHCTLCMLQSVLFAASKCSTLRATCVASRLLIHVLFDAFHRSSIKVCAHSFSTRNCLGLFPVLRYGCAVDIQSLQM